MLLIERKSLKVKLLLFQYASALCRAPNRQNLCFSAATGYWLAGERGRAMCWVALGIVEVAAIGL